VKKFLTLFILLLIGSGIWWFFRSREAITLPTEETPKPAEVNEENKEAQNQSAASPFPSGGRYRNISPGFSFEVPDGFTVRSLNAEGGTILVVENQVPQKSLQIFISTIDDDLPITSERVMREVPDIKVGDAKEIKVGGAQGLIFSSDNPAFEGLSREAWFSYKGSLYQVTTFEKNADALTALLSAWQW